MRKNQEHMKENQKIITLDRIYTTRLKARLVKNSEGWFRFEKYGHYQPVGIEVIDKLAVLLANTTIFRTTTIAAQMSMDLNILKSLVMYHMEMKLSDLLKQYKMKVAKELLTYTDLDLKEVAVRCGYTNYNTFATLFSQIEGCWPRNYRWQNQPSNIHEVYRW